MTQSLNDTVAAEVRAELGRQRVSGAELAKRLGVSGVWVSRRLNAHQPLTTDDLEAISRALDVSVTAFLPGSAA
jgi:transcriptional regulator with XRE-family HTH domain